MNTLEISNKNNWVISNLDNWYNNKITFEFPKNSTFYKFYNKKYIEIGKNNYKIAFQKLLSYYSDSNNIDLFRKKYFFLKYFKNIECLIIKSNISLNAYRICWRFEKYLDENNLNKNSESRAIALKNNTTVNLPVLLTDAFTFNKQIVIDKDKLEDIIEDSYSNDATTKTIEKSNNFEDEAQVNDSETSTFLNENLNCFEIKTNKKVTEILKIIEKSEFTNHSATELKMMFDKKNKQILDFNNLKFLVLLIWLLKEKKVIKKHNYIKISMNIFSINGTPLNDLHSYKTLKNNFSQFRNELAKNKNNDNKDLLVRIKLSINRIKNSI